MLVVGGGVGGERGELVRDGGCWLEEEKEEEENMVV